MIDKSANIPGHVRDFITGGRLVAFTRSAIVKNDHGESFRQLLDEVDWPCERTEPIAHDENERRPGAADAVSNPGAVYIGVPHRIRTTGQWAIRLWRVVRMTGLALLVHNAPA